MLNPKEITSKKFDKGFGYKAEDVDAFLKEVAIAYATALKDNENNEDKILTLVERINQYRADEDAIKETLLGAQKQANRLVAEASAEAERMLAEAKSESERLSKDAVEVAQKLEADAKLKADRTIAEQKSRTQQVIEATKIQYDAEQDKLIKMRLEVTNFKEQLTDLYNRQLHLIMEMPELSEEELAQMLEEKKAALNAPVIFADDEGEEADEEEPTAEAEADEKPADDNSDFHYEGNTYKPTESRYGELKFGLNK